MECKIKKYGGGDTIVKTEIGEFWLCRVLKGGLRVNLDLAEYEVREKTIFAVTEGVNFKVVGTSADMELEVLVFGGQIMNVAYSLLGAEADFGSLDLDFLTDRRFKPPFPKIMAADYRLLQLAVGQPPLTGRNKMVTATLVHLLLAVYNAAIEGHRQPQAGSGKRSRLVLNHFFECLDEFVPTGRRTVAFYADRLCISVRYLYKICISETGQPPKDFIDQYLTAIIKNLLLTTEMSSQQIATQLAFPDQSAFGQYFRRQTGMSPSAFKEKYR